jgi:hypothetical protein
MSEYATELGFLLLYYMHLAKSFVLSTTNFLLQQIRWSMPVKVRSLIMLF